MPNIGPHTLDLLTLLRLPGFGPVRTLAAIELLGSPGAVLTADETTLRAIPGIGPRTARSVRTEAKRARRYATDQLDQAENAGVHVLTSLDPEYPALLRPLADRPPVLFVRGRLEALGADRFSVGMVGSRRCSSYGLEQSERFGGALAAAGLTVVSGGARGIDSAAHRGAVQANGRTIVVLGCGLDHVYPPENRGLFDRIAEEHGCILSELPLDAPPSPEHFPSRNRIISGLSLGVLVVEAGRKSGALITARLAAEDHGRDVFTLPGRVDQSACAGSLDLIKSGGALMVTEPHDVITGLESAARHAHGGTFEHRFLAASEPGEPTNEPSTTPAAARPEPEFDNDAARAVYDACAEPRSLDELVRVTGMPSADLAREVTMLELRGVLIREGARLRRR
ncbi:MAG: DNA-processing protein DprA [Planctomycetota bacterium]